MLVILLFFNYNESYLSNELTGENILWNKFIEFIIKFVNRWEISWVSVFSSISNILWAKKNLLSNPSYLLIIASNDKFDNKKITFQRLIDDGFRICT